MRCPICSHEDSKVVDSRPTESGTIRRRRECLGCKHRFTTYEVIEVIPILVVKKNGSKEIFDRQKLLGGLIKSCYKRPIKVSQLEELVDNIEQELYNSLRGEVTSVEVGEMVMSRLKALDEVSYVRFASVYREFKDIDTFLSEIRELQKKSKENKK